MVVVNLASVSLAYANLADAICFPPAGKLRSAIPTSRVEEGRRSKINRELLPAGVEKGQTNQKTVKNTTNSQYRTETSTRGGCHPRVARAFSFRNGYDSCAQSDF